MRKYYIPCIYMYTYCPLGNVVIHTNTSGVLLLLRWYLLMGPRDAGALQMVSLLLPVDPKSVSL